MLTPLALAVAGPALAGLGARPVLAFAAVGQMLAVLLFSWAGLRERSRLRHRRSVADHQLQGDQQAA